MNDSTNYTPGPQPGGDPERQAPDPARTVESLIDDIRVLSWGQARVYGHIVELATDDLAADPLDLHWLSYFDVVMRVIHEKAEDAYVLSNPLNRESRRSVR